MPVYLTSLPEEENKITPVCPACRQARLLGNILYTCISVFVHRPVDQAELNYPSQHGQGVVLVCFEQQGHDFEVQRVKTHGQWMSMRPQLGLGTGPPGQFVFSRTGCKYCQAVTAC